MTTRPTRTSRTTVDSGGRIVLPVEYRRALGLAPGSEVVLVLREAEVRVLTPRQALKDARARLAPYLEGGDPVEELLEERRRDARQE